MAEFLGKGGTGGAADAAGSAADVGGGAVGGSGSGGGAAAGNGGSTNTGREAGLFGAPFSARAAFERQDCSFAATARPTAAFGADQQAAHSGSNSNCGFVGEVVLLARAAARRRFPGTGGWS